MSSPTPCGIAMTLRYGIHVATLHHNCLRPFIPTKTIPDLPKPRQKQHLDWTTSTRNHVLSLPITYNEPIHPPIPTLYAERRLSNQKIQTKKSPQTSKTRKFSLKRKKSPWKIIPRRPLLIWRITIRGVKKPFTSPPPTQPLK